MLRIFIMEDEIDRYPRSQIAEVLINHELTIAKSCPEAIEKYKAPYDLLLLDHDMEGFFEDSEYPNTGHQFCKWLVVEQCEHRPPQVVLHSQNPTGRKNMKLLLKDHGWNNILEIPFGPDYVKLLKTI